MSEDKPRGPGPRVPFPVVLVVLLVVGLGAGKALAPWWTRRQLIDDLADPARRTLAYQKLLDQGPDAVPALLGVLEGDRSSLARAEAVELLGRIRDQRAYHPILSIDEPELAHVRLEALGRLGGSGALAEVLSALRGPDPSLQFPALRALTDWSDGEEPDAFTANVVPEVEPFLTHGEAGLREFAAKFMGTRRHQPAVPALIGLLRDDDGSVRQMAAWALAQLGTGDAVAAVDSAIQAGAVSPDGL